MTLAYLGTDEQRNAASGERERARRSVRARGSQIAMMAPAKLFYKRPQQPATEVAIRSTPLATFTSCSRASTTAAGLATFQVFLTPLVFWLWAGGLMMAFGTVIVMWPNVRERAAIVAAVRAPAALDLEPQPVPGGD